MTSIYGQLGPALPAHRFDEPIAPHDVISRANTSPFYRVVAVDGNWAWVRLLDAEHSQSIVFHPHFTRGNLVPLRQAA